VNSHQYVGTNVGTQKQGIEPMALTALKVKNAKAGRHVDGRGLCLLVKDSGARTWVLRMQRDGRRRDYGLGSVADMSLADARDAAAALRRQVRAGVDPVAERRMSRKVIPTFETVARHCYEALKEGWKNRRHANWISSFENHVFPIIGTRPVDAVDSTAVLEVLSPIWAAFVRNGAADRKGVRRVDGHAYADPEQL
jgi:hypothetical protein